jgi:hypothetical protein
MEIYTHAIDNYINRIIEEDPLETDAEERESIKKKIRIAAVKPERIHHSEPEKPPIHIRDKIAAVVGVKNDRDNYVPYEDFGEDNIVVPAVYHSNTFSIDDDTKTRSRT